MVSAGSSQPSVICKSRPRESDALFWPQWAPTTLNARIHKVKQQGLIGSAQGLALLTTQQQQSLHSDYIKATLGDRVIIRSKSQLGTRLNAGARDSMCEALGSGLSTVGVGRRLRL